MRRNERRGREERIDEGKKRWKGVKGTREEARKGVKNKM